MPTTKDVMEQMSEGWTLSDKIDEMRGKFQLKRLCKNLADSLAIDKWTVGEIMGELKGQYRLRRKDREAYQDSTTKDIRNNEKRIAFLRKDNRKKRITLAQHENGDERVIKSVFEENREERLSLQRYTASEAIEEMDQKVCEADKLLNNLRYERESAERNLEELTNEHQCMVFLEQKSPEQLQAEQSTTQLENALDKALIKYDTARIITKRYGEILDRLKDDSLTLPSRLEAMEQALLAQKHELRELKEMGKDAMQLRDEAKRQLCQVEMESIDARRQREAELTSLRREVERRKIDTDKSEKKAFKASLLSDQQDMKLLAEQQQKRERQKKILTYEEALQRIKEATHVTDVADVVQRVLTQAETKSKLKERVSELEGQTNRLKDENEKLRMQYHDLKYSGNRKLSKGQQLLEKTHDHLCKEGRRNERITDSLERGGMTMVEVKTGTGTLLEKLCDIKLPPPHFNYVKDGDIFDQMEICRNKVNQLMKEVESKKELQQLTAEGIVTSEFQDFLELQLPPDNSRITTMVSETNISEFGFESQENEVLSRFDIKNMCQRLIDSKEKKTKKKKIKKK